jgi:eukaryotic-like serine/threonine-protein kinase
VNGLGVELVLGLVGGLVLGLVFGLVAGLVSGLLKREEVGQYIQPNQGIWQSARNMWVGGLVVGLVGWGAGWLLGELVGELVSRLGSRGLIGGLIGGLTTYGGNACIQHIVLRSLLTHYKYAPLNYARFLDYCAARIFLRKVGGGYIFVHRLLMEYFAVMTEEDIKRLASLTSNSL